MAETYGIDKQLHAYKLTFSIENTLRVSMHNLMVNKEGHHYFTEAIFPPLQHKLGQDSASINVVSFAKQRKATERQNNLSLGYDYPHLWYLDLNHLVLLIDDFWDKYFQRLFRQAPSKMKQHCLVNLTNTIRIRNAVAHHRYVSNEDVAELNGVYKYLQDHMENQHLFNYHQLVFNSFELVVRTFVCTCEEVMGQLKKGLYIEEITQQHLYSGYSAIASVLPRWPLQNPPPVAGSKSPTPATR